jgi:hypothetical protein
LASEPEAAAIAEEQRRLLELRRTVDVACALLRQADLTRAEAEGLAAAARREALRLFPDKAGVYDLVIAPRMARILRERWPGRGARLLPFRRAAGGRRGVSG